MLKDVKLVYTYSLKYNDERKSLKSVFKLFKKTDAYNAEKNYISIWRYDSDGGNSYGEICIFELI